MQNVSQCNTPSMGQPQNAVYDKLQQSSNLQLAASSSERSADITIITDDEDTVTLSIDSHVKAVALTYEEMARTGSSYSESRGEMVGIDISQEVKFSVDGTLDAQERKEIKQVLETIFKMVKDFLSGAFGQGMEAAQQFDELESISSVKAEFEAKDTTAYVSQSVAREVTQVQAPAPKAVPKLSAPGRGRPPVIKPEVAPRAVPTANTESTKAPVEVLADRMVEVVKESGVDPAKVQKPVDKMFGRLMRKFLKDGPFNFRKMRRLRSIMQEFSRKIDQLTNPEKSEAPLFQPITDEAVDQIAPMEVFTMKKSSVQTQVSIFEQSVSFSFEYSAAKPDETTDEDVSVQA